MGRVQDKVALVTGGASGVGRETVKLLLQEGAFVAISDINTDAGEAFASECGARAMFVRHDVSSEADWSAAVQAVQQRFGPLNILINNAGILLPGNIATGTLAQFRQLMRINADSCFLGCQQGVAAMKEGGGSIVNMASVSSWLPIENYAAYSASKAAVAALTRATALYCRKSGHAVRVNSLHPDGIYTPMMQASAPGVPAHHLLFDPKTNPKGRACLPEQIAKVLLFLASDDSQAISGAEIRADSAILGMGL
ncbi:MAG: SDR family oxidoreductase [Polaromonas sp.]